MRLFCCLFSGGARLSGEFSRVDAEFLAFATFQARASSEISRIAALFARFSGEIARVMGKFSPATAENHRRSELEVSRLRKKEPQMGDFLARVESGL